MASRVFPLFPSNSCFLLSFVGLLLQACLTNGRVLVAQAPAEQAKRIALPIFTVPQQPGCFLSYREVNVTLGTPGQTRSLLLNSAQHLTWTFGSDTKGGDAGPPNSFLMNPLFDPNKSTTLSFTKPTDQACADVAALGDPPMSTSDGDNSYCTFNLSSLDGYAAGTIAQDILAVGSPRKNMSGAGPIGLSKDSKGVFFNSSFDGELSLSLANTSFFSSITKSLGIPKIMSICVNGSAGGVLSIGELPDAIASSVEYVPMVKNPVDGGKTYAVQATKAKFGGFTTEGEDWKAITAFSTAADVMLLPQYAFDAFVTEISHNISQSPEYVLPSYYPFGNTTIFYAPSCKPIKFPELHLSFGNVTLTMSGEDYTAMDTKPDSAGRCHIYLKAFVWPVDIMVLGGPPKKTWLVVNAENSQIGFAQNQPCVE